MKNIFRILFCFFSIASNAQDIQYRLGTSSPVQFNPAFCGDAFHRNINYNRIIAGYQGANILNESHTFFSYDAYHWNLGSSIGLIAQENRPGRGLVKLRSVSAIYGYILPLTKQIILRFGIQAGVESKQTDPVLAFRLQEFPERILLLDPIYRREAESSNGIMKQKNYFTSGFGSIIETKHLDGGIALQNINRPDWSLIENSAARKALLFNAHAIYRFYNHKKYRISAKAAFSYQGLENQVQGGFQFKSRYLMCGLFYRHLNAYRLETDCISAAIGYNLYHFQIRLGSEYNLNSGNGPAQFSQSLSLQYLFHSSGVRVCRPVFRKMYPDESL